MRRQQRVDRCSTQPVMHAAAHGGQSNDASPASADHITKVDRFGISPSASTSSPTSTPNAADVCRCGRHRISTSPSKTVTLRRQWTGTKFGLTIKHAQDPCSDQDHVLRVTAIAARGLVGVVHLTFANCTAQMYACLRSDRNYICFTF